MKRSKIAFLCFDAATTRSPSSGILYIGAAEVLTPKPILLSFQWDWRQECLKLTRAPASSIPGPRPADHTRLGLGAAPLMSRVRHSSSSSAGLRCQVLATALGELRGKQFPIVHRIRHWQGFGAGPCVIISIGYRWWYQSGRQGSSSSSMCSNCVLLSAKQTYMS